MTTRRYVSYPQAARLVGHSVSSIHHWAKAGRYGPLREGRGALPLAGLAAAHGEFTADQLASACREPVYTIQDLRNMIALNEALNKESADHE